VNGRQAEGHVELGRRGLVLAALGLASVLSWTAQGEQAHLRRPTRLSQLAEDTGLTAAAIAKSNRLMELSQLSLADVLVLDHVFPEGTVVTLPNRPFADIQKQTRDVVSKALQADAERRADDAAWLKERVRRDRPIRSAREEFLAGEAIPDREYLELDVAGKNEFSIVGGQESLGTVARVGKGAHVRFRRAPGAKEVSLAFVETPEWLAGAMNGSQERWLADQRLAHGSLGPIAWPGEAPIDFVGREKSVQQLLREAREERLHPLQYDLGDPRWKPAYPVEELHPWRAAAERGVLEEAWFLFRKGRLRIP